MQAVAPTLFSMSGNGSGVAAALAVAVQAGNPQVQSPVPVFQCGGTGCVSVPIDLGVDRPVYVSFYGTGIRNRSSLANVTVTINGVSVPVLYAGAAPDYVGLDQVNVGLPLTLRGSGEVQRGCSRWTGRLRTPSRLTFSDSGTGIQAGPDHGVRTCSRVVNRVHLQPARITRSIPRRVGRTSRASYGLEGPAKPAPKIPERQPPQARPTQSWMRLRVPSQPRGQHPDRSR